MLENNSIHNRLKKNQNYLGINLTKEVKDLFSENHKILKKSKTPEDGKASHEHGLAELIP
jgi:hypothetical protein